MELAEPVIGAEKSKALLAALWKTEAGKASALPFTR